MGRAFQTGARQRRGGGGPGAQQRSWETAYALYMAAKGGGDLCGVICAGIIAGVSLSHNTPHGSFRATATLCCSLPPPPPYSPSLSLSPRSPSPVLKWVNCTTRRVCCSTCRARWRRQRPTHRCEAGCGYYLVSEKEVRECEGKAQDVGRLIPRCRGELCRRKRV